MFAQKTFKRLGFYNFYYQWSHLNLEFKNSNYEFLIFLCDGDRGLFTGQLKFQKRDIILVA